MGEARRGRRRFWSKKERGKGVNMRHQLLLGSCINSPWDITEDSHSGFDKFLQASPGAQSLLL
jgi:hypothetical protein